MIAVVLRRRVLPEMDTLGIRIQSNDVNAIPGFRRTHVAAIVVNVVQLVVIVWSLTALNP